MKQTSLALFFLIGSVIIFVVANRAIMDDKRKTK